MAEVQEIYCEVRAGGSIYRDWTSVSVSQSMTDNWYRAIRLQCAEVSTIGAVQRLAPEDEISVSLGGQPFITNGKIRVRQAAYDANRHAVQIEGWGFPGEAVESSVDIAKTGSQFRGYTLDGIANAVLKPLGLKLKMTNAPKGADTKFDNIMVHTGETVFSFIERLARQRDCMLWADADGTINAGLPKGEGGGAQLIEGVNILAANCTITDQASRIEFLGQDSGTDERFGSSVAQVVASAPIGGMKNKRLLTMLAEEPATKKELQLRTNRESRQLLAMSVQARVTHQGWYKPGTRELWGMGDEVKVRSPMLFPTKSGELPLRVWDVTWSQDAQAGTTTTVTLVNEGVFQAAGYGDATKNDGFFTPKTTEAA